MFIYYNVFQFAASIKICTVYQLKLQTENYLFMCPISQGMTNRLNINDKTIWFELILYLFVITDSL